MKVDRKYIISVAMIAGMMVPGVAQADDLVVPDENGNVTTLSPTDSSSAESSDSSSKETKAEKEDKETKATETSASETSTKESESESQETTETSSTPQEIKEWVETPSEDRGNYQFIDMTCGLGDAITDYSDKFGGEPAHCVNGEIQGGNTDEEIVDNMGSQVKDNGESSTQSTPTQEAQPTKEDEKPKETAKETEPKETVKETESKETKQSESEESSAEKETESQEKTSPTEATGLDIPAPVPDKPSKSQETSSEKPTETEKETQSKEDIDSEKEMKQMSDSAYSLLSDYVKDHEGDDLPDDEMLPILTAISMMDNGDKVENLISKNENFAQWFEKHGEDVKKAQSTELKEPMANIVQWAEKQNLDTKDAEKLVESYNNLVVAMEDSK